MANAKYILEGEGHQWCGFGVRRAVSVEVMGLNKDRVKKGKG